ncbi:MAG: hypothetical protein OEO79_13990 [Gemmatimonadota bacterium]|nr:hypothetical protein [Gemmatimonadota bacterium]
MLRTTLTFIQHRTSGQTILALSAGTALLMFLMNGTQLPFSTPTIVEHSGGVSVLDLRWSFTPEDAYELFAALGPEGRQAYLMQHLVPDMAFPIGYALVFAFTSAWFLVRLLPLDHHIQWLSVLPLISGLADMLENLLLVTANLAYPGRVDWVVRCANLLTRVKFGLAPIGLVLLAAIVAVWLIRRRPGSNVPIR